MMKTSEGRLSTQVAPRDDDGENLLEIARRVNPALVKYLQRVLRDGLRGENAIKEAMRRLEEASRSEEIDMARAMQSTSLSTTTRAASAQVVPKAGYRALDENIMGLRRKPAPGIWADEGYAQTGNTFLAAPESAQLISLASPLAGLINALPAIMKNPRYQDYYLSNIGHSLPIPLPATDGIANKTVGVRGSVSSAFTVPAGARCAVFPTPDHYHNSPFSILWDNTSGLPTVNEGQWYGGISPQALVGTPPPGNLAGPVGENNVDDRSLQFKGGLLELNVAVAYNQSCVVGHLDPYATMGYGMALGMMQARPGTVKPDLAYSSQFREYPYFSQAPPTVEYSNLMDRAVKTTLVGSSAASGVSYRQIVRPFAHSFFAAVDPNSTTGIISEDLLANLGYPANLHPPILRTVATYAQGMYLIDNSNGTSAVAVDLKMEMAYRVRVDNQAPAIYMTADSDAVPKHSIEFKPTTAVAANPAAAALIQHRLAGSKAPVLEIMPRSATTNHIGDTTKAIRDNGPSVMKKITNVVSKVPVVGGGVSTALLGGEKIATANDVGDVFAGLFDVGKGAVDVFTGLFGF